MCYSGDCSFENYMGDCMWTIKMALKLKFTHGIDLRYPCSSSFGALPEEHLEKAKEVFYEIKKEGF